MKLRTIVSIKKDGVWVRPDSVIEMEKGDEADRLIRLGAATPVDSDIPMDNEPAPNEIEEMVTELSKIDGVNDDLAVRLVEAGFESIASVAEASPEELMAVKGIGKKNCETIQDSAEELSS